MSALITTDSPYLHRLGTLTEAQETIVTKLIEGASEAVERFCRRKFAVATYDEVVCAGEMGMAFLDNYPVISVDRVFTYKADLFRIRNTVCSQPPSPQPQRVFGWWL